jgi:hypothetical protein
MWQLGAQARRRRGIKSEQQFFRGLWRQSLRCLPRTHATAYDTESKENTHLTEREGGLGTVRVRGETEAIREFALCLRISPGCQLRKK